MSRSVRQTYPTRVEITGNIEVHHPVKEIIYCPAQTYRSTRDNPAEHCENEVADYGDLCSRHEEDDRSDELYEAYLESKWSDA